MKPILATKRPLIMGIINLTTDSFSGDGLAKAADPAQEALEQARRFLSEGADLLDLGAESTRPGATVLEWQQELERLLPVIALLHHEWPELPLSIDSYHADTAKACLQAGASIINDIWGFQSDPRMAETVASFGASAVLMHNRREGQLQVHPELGGRIEISPTEDLIAEVQGFWEQSIVIARDAGLQNDQIILDPGIGFGKSTAQNLWLLKNTASLRFPEFKLLLGLSRKSFIGYTLGLPPQERLEGSLVANLWAAMQGADFLRVHDVRATARSLQMLNAIENARIDD